LGDASLYFGETQFNLMPVTFKHQSILIGLIFTITACDWGRTPSRERFEKNCHITLPSDVQVLRDEYQDMGSDYAIYYTLKFNPGALKTFVNGFKKSNYYDDVVFLNRTINNTILKESKNNNGVWRKSLQGYQFYKKIGEIEFTEFNINLDTAARIASFEEAAN
jgi:hypothetical protein